MRQGGSPPTGKWIGSPQGGVKAPDAILLPDPATRFTRTATRLQTLSAGHPMQDWLRFMAELSRAQHAAAAAPAFSTGLIRAALEQVEAAGVPPLAADAYHRGPIWRDGLAVLLGTFDCGKLPAQVAVVMQDLRRRDAVDLEVLADDFLNGGISESEAGAALYVAAALQVYFTSLASGLDSSSLRLLEERGLCPCCGSTPVSGLITASGQTPGTRYLYCSLCSTAWVHTRAVCITCGGSRALSLRGIEGDVGAVKAETCDECHTYAKMLYQAKDTGIDPFADDLATLWLDIMVAEAGWARHAPNPLLLVG